MKKKRLLWIGGGLVVLILLSGAAYLGVRLLYNRPVLPVDIRGSIGARIDNGKGNPIQITFDRASELPQANADLIGEVTSVQGNSVYVSSKGKSDVTPSASIEVVLTRDTKIYRDTTLDNQPPPTASRHVQQVVQLVNQSQIARIDMLEVWGQRRGERLAAEVIVIHGPAVINK